MKIIESIRNYIGSLDCMATYNNAINAITYIYPKKDKEYYISMQKYNFITQKNEWFLKSTIFVIKVRTKHATNR